MNREEITEKTIEQIDVKYVEESAQYLQDAPSGMKARRSVRWILPAAASLLFLCLVGGIAFLVIRNGSQTGPSGPVAEQPSSEEETLPEQIWTFHVTVVGTTNGGTSTVDLTDVGTTTWFESKTAPKEWTLSFMGKEYTGTYTRSERSSLRDDWINSYNVRDGSMCLGFSVNGVTGRPVGIELGGYGMAALKADRNLPALSTNELREIAVTCAGEWLPLEDYSEDYKKTIIPSTTTILYRWTFVRKIQGIDTTDMISLQLSDRGTLLGMHMGQPGWTEDHKEELDSFPVEEAIEQAKTASGLTGPTVTMKRFELGRDGYVFLRLGLEGRYDERSLILSVTATRPLPDESNAADETGEPAPQHLLLSEVPENQRIFVMLYPYEGKDDMVADRDAIAERIASEFDLICVSDYPAMRVAALSTKKALSDYEFRSLLEAIGRDPDVFRVSRGSEHPSDPNDLVDNMVHGPEPIALSGLDGPDAPKGWKEYETLQEAETAVGFTLLLPDIDLPKVYRTYEDWLIEVIFVKDGQELYRLRKGKGFGNVSGDSTMKASMSTSINNSPMTNVGGPKERSESDPDEMYRIAIRQYQAFSYSVTSAEWLPFEEIIRFFEDDPVKTFL